MATPSDLTNVGSSKPCQSAQTRKTSEQACIYIYICQTCFLVYFFPLPFKILIIYIKKNSQLLFANRYDPKVPPVSII